RSPLRRRQLNLVLGPAEARRMDWYSVRQSLGPTLCRFTDRAVKVLAVARNKAKGYRLGLVTPEHGLLALPEAEPGPGRVTLDRLGVDLGCLREDLGALAAGDPRPGSSGTVALSPAAAELVLQAEEQARALGHDYVGTEHLVLGLLATGPSPAAEF